MCRHLIIFFVFLSCLSSTAVSLFTYKSFFCKQPVVQPTYSTEFCRLHIFVKNFGRFQKNSGPQTKREAPKVCNSCFIAYESCSQKYAHIINIHITVLCLNLWIHSLKLMSKNKVGSSYSTGWFPTWWNWFYTKKSMTFVFSLTLFSSYLQPFGRDMDP